MRSDHEPLGGKARSCRAVVHRALLDLVDASRDLAAEGTRNRKVVCGAARRRCRSDRLMAAARAATGKRVTARLAAGPTQQWKMQSASATAAAARGLHTARWSAPRAPGARAACERRGSGTRGRSAPRARSAGGQRSRSEAGRREAASGAAHRRRVTSSRPRRRAAAARAARARSRRARAEGRRPRRPGSKEPTR